MASTATSSTATATATTAPKDQSKSVEIKPDAAASPVKSGTTPRTTATAKSTVPTPISAKDIPANAFRILLTGFGPFYHYKENPSWLAVKPLHNVIIRPESLSNPITVDGKAIALEDSAGKPRPIHLTTIEVPMTYEAVLGTVPGLHARPPVLPPNGPDEVGETRPDIPTPPNGYDVIFHVGVAGRGPLRMERLGHKLGYHMKDASGKLAPIVQASPKDNAAAAAGADADEEGADDRLLAENIERERLGMEIVPPEPHSGETSARPSRGFGAGYDTFPDELMTDIDVLRMVQDLKRCGTEQIYTSMDAGHYLSDYMYYCSLAESRRHVKPYEKKRCTQVLFMHCGPVGQPLSSDDVTEALKRLLVWVCNEIIKMDNADVDAAPGAPGALRAVKPTPGGSEKPPGSSTFKHNPLPPKSTLPDGKGKQDAGKARQIKSLG
ncbi:hypothetical protein JOM56_004421 [Amanita muscaria]